MLVREKPWGGAGASTMPCLTKVYKLDFCVSGMWERQSAWRRAQKEEPPTDHTDKHRWKRFTTRFAGDAEADEKTRRRFTQIRDLHEHLVPGGGGVLKIRNTEAIHMD